MMIPISLKLINVLIHYYKFIVLFRQKIVENRGKLIRWTRTVFFDKMDFELMWYVKGMWENQQVHVILRKYGKFSEKNHNRTWEIRINEMRI